jgi:hypothetical protein
MVHLLSGRRGLGTKRVEVEQAYQMLTACRRTTAPVQESSGVLQRQEEVRSKKLTR